jgi:hypothetical protein
MSTDGAKKLMSSRLANMKFMQRKEESVTVQKLDADRTAVVAAAKWTASPAVHGPAVPPARSAAGTPAAAAASAARPTFIVETTDGSIFEDSLAEAFIDGTGAHNLSGGAGAGRAHAGPSVHAASELARMRLGRRSFGGFNASLQMAMRDAGADNASSMADSEAGAVTAEEMARALGGNKKRGERGVRADADADSGSDGDDGGRAQAHKSQGQVKRRGDDKSASRDTDKRPKKAHK